MKCAKTEGRRWQICPVMPVLLLVVIFFAIACGGPAVTENRSATETKAARIERIVQSIQEMPIGSVGPSLMYGIEHEVYIVHFRGILRYDWQAEKIVDAIDNVALGLTTLQGSDPVQVAGKSNKVLIFNQEKAYFYNRDDATVKEASVAALPKCSFTPRFRPEPAGFLAPGMLLAGESADGLLVAERPIVLAYRWEQDGGRSWYVRVQTDGGKVKSMPVFPN